ncbi:ClbS/DfsB family four-helix bundle protein [Campylobacter sp. MOP51]|uniref:ClbS/DfsB family four-helix bundle protein n=1 Tax=Campylobacter canis TaxID=3378588 RepID=UPI003C4AD81C
MPRPTTKDDLVLLANGNFIKLFDLIESMSAEEQEMKFNFEDRDKNIKDVLIHLYEWHVLLLNFIRSNQNSKEINPFLPYPYNWQTYPKMNIEIWQKHQNTPLDTAKILLKNSHKEVIKAVDKFSDEELFTKSKFAYTLNSTLGSYCISATSSHYDWAIKKIKKHKKGFKKL